MNFVNRRFVKLLRVAVFVVFGCVLFIAATHYVYDGANSVSGYGKHLQEHLSGTATVSAPSAKTAASAVAGGAGGGVPAAAGAAAAALDSMKLKKFYSRVFQNIIDFSPSGATKKQYKPECRLEGDIGSRPDDYSNFDRLGYDNLVNCLNLSGADISNLRHSHKSFVDSLDVTLPSNSYKGSGIVTVGGGKFSLMAFLIVQNIRRMGTTLPVEVFIPPNEGPETEFCTELLPKYNAKCIFIDRILPDEMIQKFDFRGYQFKSLALVASSFENTLLLDADNFPVKPLNSIFNEEPFKSKGLVLWPDFWRRTTQPLYYDIAGVPVNLKNRVRNSFDDLTPPEVYTENMNDLSGVPFHDLEGTMPDVSTESGQLMVNKNKHLGTILLALYYNVNGPTWYYPIFSQKAAGEGDKETFIAAANFYGLPFYQVKSSTSVDGYFENGEFHGVAMLQYDCVQDYKLYQIAKDDIDVKYGLSRVGNSASQKRISFDKSYSLEDFKNKYFREDSHNDVMFIHSNFPKFDPLSLWKNRQLVDKDGNHFRSYTNLRKFGDFDIELENFKIFKNFFCGDQKVSYFSYLYDALEKTPTGWNDMCEYINKRLVFLEKTHLEAVNKKD
ncbi:alpha-1,2-mannosyltransferase MNN2 KNAG_0K01290 [Huiozyma naganishii CBS 8797]|uniref:Alpha-1,2-mannosyltransferase MNN2 n=1 Tax=Huiozyma naganishii (strain ATCC MYA-139 / BCRC 22969 / CBS 8797 / KCTC 17520 / NBRC 10181 / NCYC 3082 / Yp74L-3) TaxID=1071383 RepID=J7SA80_HUIN7|nr:hypothetical protein KNAG_0K01290 [Kazachstania naganishii CBS 8797]CCK72494.1 hypothetical protein KNAG_0K01290 [Kazachstania naganishii CBS 8797]